MLVGHFSSTFVGKALAPRTPAWVLLIAAQLVDVAWAILVLAGIERFTLDPSLPSNPLVLEYMPFTHSLAATLGWGALAGAAVMAVPSLGGTPRAALVVGAVVVSHWVLDLVVHRPDLTLVGGESRLGFGLWNFPLTAFVVEIALLIATAAYWATRPGVGSAERRAGARAVGVLVLVQIATVLAPLPSSKTALVMTMLLTLTTLAWAAARLERRVGS